MGPDTPVDPDPAADGGAGPRQVLDFWFAPADSPVHGTQRPEWFRKDPAFDAEIGRRFGTLIDAALAGELAAWAAGPATALAQILVLDQFTRNVFRGTARAFAGDAQALAAARAMVDAGLDLQLPPFQRGFVYLPFEHAEDMACQRQSLRLIEALTLEAPELADLLVWARRHADVIARFGRYPHRNAALGRTDTDEERAFLQQPGSGF